MARGLLNSVVSTSQGSTQVTWNVHQHWDPLKVCIVGRSYPPEFYSWIKKPHVRSLFERIAIETEEDYQNIIKKLESFGVEILRPDLHTDTFVNGKFVPPPMTPRDYTVMVGDKFYSSLDYFQDNFSYFYRRVKDPQWPDCKKLKDFYKLPKKIQEECVNVHKMNNYVLFNKPVRTTAFDRIFERIKLQGNSVIEILHPDINGAMITRIGKDLYFGTLEYNEPIDDKINVVNSMFTETRNHVINTGGHSDGTYCPVCPGLIISLRDVPCYADTYPGWEVVYLPEQSWGKIKDFVALKQKNHGKWWIPGFEQDQSVIDLVETWLGHWTGYVEETVFDVNMLIIDHKNVMVFNYNKQVFDALERYGITPHIVPFRHRYFWDGGIHCVTSDLHREGTMQDYFPGRNQ